MIPLILELKNFLSYGEPMQKIDFSPHSLICLSGKNGHGKSALLDALTWALWGQARKTLGSTKADEGLLRLGKTQMLVCLDFAFANKTYRVRREFAKTYGKPYATLDFDVFDEQNQKFISLTDKTIKITQAKINQLLGLDYETFINSAFLRQGQSNEFSKKSARERKDILATILGLNKYALLQQKALEKGRHLATQKASIVGAQQRLEEELLQQPEIKEKIDEHRQQLTVLTEQIATSQNNQKTIHDQHTSCKAQQQALKNIEMDYENKKISYTKQINLFQQTVREWKETHARLLLFPHIKNLEAEKNQLEAEEQRLNASQQISLQLGEQLLKTKELHHQRLVLLKTQYDVIIQQQKMLTQQQELELKQHMQQLTQCEQEVQIKQNKHTEILKQTQELAKEIIKQCISPEQLTLQQKQFEKRKAYYQAWVQKGNWVKSEITDLVHKQKAVNNPQPSCPLCEQLLTVKRKQFLAGQLTHHEIFLHSRLQRITELLKKLKNILIEQHAYLAQQTDAVTKQDQIKMKLEHIERSAQELETEIKTLTNQATEITVKLAHNKTLLTQEQNKSNDLEKTGAMLLETDPELVHHAQTLKTIDEEKQKNVFNQEQYNNIKNRLSTLQKTINEGYASQQMQHIQNERKKTICAIAMELKTLKKTIAEAQAHLASKTQLQETEALLLAQTNTLSQQITLLVQEKEKLVHRFGSLEHEYARLEKLKDESAKNLLQTKALDEEINDFQHIATALSKNGIQALLIEDAIPEIEAEANVIISRLTNNQASIFIESLKDLKSGGVKETLDIRIADGVGLRPYEMFSGGEAFRIDFALRIAIAKLLARRAGTALQTLIIDEGFGSQDEEGLGFIMEALHAIQQDFSKIIVVSHLQEFKHNFPVHLIIEKGPSGSTVSVEERG